MDILGALLLLVSGVVGLTIGSGRFHPLLIGKQRRTPPYMVNFSRPTWMNFGTGLATLALAYMTQWDLVITFSLSYNFGLAMWQISVSQLIRCSSKKQ